jgi:hypothetical protein
MGKQCFTIGPLSSLERELIYVIDAFCHTLPGYRMEDERFAHAGILTRPAGNQSAFCLSRRAWARIDPVLVWISGR